MAAANLTRCVANQVDKLAWSVAPADWRVALCLDGPVTKFHAKYMYQSNEQLVSG